MELEDTSYMDHLTIEGEDILYDFEYALERELQKARLNLEDAI